MSRLLYSLTLNERQACKNEDKTMNYTKPEVVVLADAAKAVQTPHSKVLGPADMLVTHSIGPAYEADE